MCAFIKKWNDHYSFLVTIMEENKSMKKFDNKSFLLYNANMNKLVEKLDNYRLENRVSQKQLADTLHVHFSTVNRWFKGKTKPNKIQRYHIKKLFEDHNFQG